MTMKPRNKKLLPAKTASALQTPIRDLRREIRSLRKTSPIREGNKRNAASKALEKPVHGATAPKWRLSE